MKSDTESSNCREKFSLDVASDGVVHALIHRREYPSVGLHNIVDFGDYKNRPSAALVMSRIDFLE